MTRSRLNLSPTDLSELVNIVCKYDTGNFADLVAHSGLDPRKHLKFADWSGVDFSRSDLRGFDFTAARLRNTNFSGSRIDGARFDQAVLNDSNLRGALDWEIFMNSWCAPRVALSDDHLPVGAIFHDAPFAPEMTVIDAGSFIMGSWEGEQGRLNDEDPQHLVSIPKPIAVGRFLVTFENGIL
jgi:hypothetical protein